MADPLRLVARVDGQITLEEYALRMAPVRARQVVEMKDQGRNDQLQRIGDASMGTIEALMVSPAQ